MEKKNEKAAPKLVDLFSMQTAVPQFVGELSRMVGDQKPNYCLQCVKCTSGCATAKLSQLEFKPHQIIGLVRLGFPDQLLDSKMIWNCTTCNYCVEVCPQDVSPVDVVRSVRRIAVKSGRILDGHKKVVKLLAETGHFVPINEQLMALRKEFGLSLLPSTTHTFPEALEEIKKILKATGFDKLIG